MPIIPARLRRLRAGLRQRSLDGFLVSSPPHVRYLTGFTGSHALLFVGRGRPVLVTDSRYRAQSAAEAPGCRRIIAPAGLADALAEHRVLNPGTRIGFDAAVETYASHRQLHRYCRGVRLIPAGELLQELLMAKDAVEVEIMQRAADISDRVFAEVVPLLRPGLRERDIATEISHRQRRHGAEGDAFEIIVASGERSALPHARASDRIMRRGDLVTLDFGCTVAGYHSDLTRTVALGRLAPRGRRMYAAVLRAQQEAVLAVRAGIPARELDALARAILTEEGFGSAFIHSLGHGLGLQVHERPRLAPRSTDILRAGHVVTVEPGVYVSGYGGVRIEDDVVVLEQGARVLNTAPRELMIV